MMILHSLVPLLALAALGQAQVLDRNCFSDENGTLSDTFLDRTGDEEAKAIVYGGERAFAVNLIKALFSKYEDKAIEQNIFISPSSIYHTLMLAYFGALGETQTELAKGLGFGDLSKSEVLKTYMLDKAYQAVRERTPDLGYTFLHANKIYFERELKLNECLRLVLADQIEAVDFKGEPEEARKGMNSWVEGLTKGNIKDLVPAGYVDYSTRAAILNAAYFKVALTFCMLEEIERISNACQIVSQVDFVQGDWSSQFKAEETALGNFYVKRDQIKMVNFMNQEGSFNYYTSEELQAHVVELPYQGDHVSMVVILPPFLDDGLQETVKRLTPETMSGVMAEIKSGFYKMDKLKVTLPKFSIRGSLELNEPLAALNISKLFGAGSNLTGFIDLDSTPADQVDQVRLESAQHKAFIEVTEEGSVAAAATALLGFRSARPLIHTKFVANHPFLFLIYDKQVDTILFFGVYQHPPTP